MTQQFAHRLWTTSDLGLLVRGPVHVPGDEHYDAQRASLNPEFDARPAVIAEAACVDDVRAAVAWASAHDLPIAVQSTGHGTHVPSDGGVLIKTTRLATVLVDPDRRIARVGAGAVWGDVLKAAAPFGLAPVSGSSPTVGVVGFSTGGGHGALSRKYGLGADNVLRADVVLADGTLVTATRDRNPDLFWAIRGGGGNFGVITSLEIRLHPVDEVYAGQALFPRARAAELLARFRSYAPAMPRELTCNITLVGDHVALRATYAGPAADAQEALRPLWIDTPVDSTFVATTPLRASVPGTAPVTFELAESLTDDLLETVLSLDANSIEIRYWGGAIAEGDSPAGHRTVPYSIIVDGPAEELWPHVTGGSFPTSLHDPDAVETAYTAADYQRLREIKGAYDPGNAFHRNMNIKPA